MASSPAKQRSVKINVNTTIQHDDHKETFAITTFGRYYEKGNSFYLQYEEVTEEGTIKSTVKVSEQETLLLRSGAIKMRMLFQEDKQCRGRYDTQYGAMALVTDTKKIESQALKDGNGTIEVKYDLAIQGSKPSTYRLKWLFEEEKK